MDLMMIHFEVLWYSMLIIFATSVGSLTDMGKTALPQNNLGDELQSHFLTKNSSRIIAQKGGLAILPCVVKLSSPATVSWIRRKDFQLLTVGLSTHSSDKRFLVEHTRHMGHWSLRIKSVRDEDRGLYECQLSIYPTQSIFVELKVVEAVAVIVGTPDLHIDEGSTLRLECKLKKATENPSFVFWYHDNKMVNYDLQDGFSVTSVLASPSHSLSNKLLPNDKLKDSRQISNSFLHNKTFTMPSNAPHAKSDELHPSSYLLVPTSSILSLQDVHLHHAGNYTCAPSNAKPSSITVHVHKGEKPAAMQHGNRSLFENDGNNSSIGGGVITFVTNGCLRTCNMFFLLRIKKTSKLLQSLQLNVGLVPRACSIWLVFFSIKFILS